MFEELKVEVGERTLEPGDTLIICSHATTPVPELAKTLVNGVFESFPRQTDDMTVVAARAR